MESEENRYRQPYLQSKDRDTDTENKHMYTKGEGGGMNWEIRIDLYTIYQRRQWQPTPVLLPGKSHGRRSLVGCSPWRHDESDTTEKLHFHFSLSRIGEGNGNPLQCFCLENPRDGRAWWTAVYGVAQSWTRLKRLSSSSSIYNIYTGTLSIYMCVYIYIYI